MEKVKIFDEEFKQKVSDSCGKIKDTLSDALLTEEGKLDTEKIGNAVTDTFRKAEDGIKDGCRKFSEEYVRDGHLDTDKVGTALNDSYQKAGRFLANSVSRLAEKLSDRFGTDGEPGAVFDSEIVTGEPEQDA